VYALAANAIVPIVGIIAENFGQWGTPFRILFNVARVCGYDEW
jgi:hypothetical protein